MKTLTGAFTYLVQCKSLEGLAIKHNKKTGLHHLKKDGMEGQEVFNYYKIAKQV